MPTRQPAYLRFEVSGIAYARTRHRGKYVSLGHFNNPESLKRYHEIVAQWRAGEGVRPEAGISVAGLVASWFAHIEETGLYQRNGQPTSERAGWRQTVAPLLRLYGTEPATEFTPRKLKALRRSIIGGSWMTDEERSARPIRERTCCRRTANQRIRHIQRLFAWGVSEELFPTAIADALDKVNGLPAGQAIDHPERGPVSDQDIKDTLPFLRPVPRAMALLQLASGMRPGEVCGLVRECLDTVGLSIEGNTVWVYRPKLHKTLHHGIKRQIPLGPAAQAVLRPFLERTGAIFTMARGGAYRTSSYAEEIRQACRKAGVPNWSPQQLRKAAATHIHEYADLDTARATLGHQTSKVTREVYAKADLRLAARSAARMG